jgi:heme exporter protein A
MKTDGARPAPDFDAVHARDVSRHYGRRRALSRVTATFRSGEIVGLFGPNGAGKSTLLALLSSLMRPSSGEVRYGDRTAADSGDALRARIGVLGHDLFLYGDLTARENLEFFARLYRLPDVARSVGEALVHARLEERAGDRVAGFSRGLRQRLALERALLHAPRLVLLDEPFTGLDDDSTSLLVARLTALRRAGAIVVMATHDFESADGLIDRALCLTDGRAAELDVAATPGRPLRERYREAAGAGRA